jgi:hypothetical protein
MERFPGELLLEAARPVVFCPYPSFSCALVSSPFPITASIISSLGRDGRHYSLTFCFSAGYIYLL